ncbi:MAG: hypothetical protein Q9179_002362 [Wetmoreana sp. 5 TL-2023]
MPQGMRKIRRPFVPSTGPRRATRKFLIGRFDKLMKDNKGGVVDFPLRYIEDYALDEALQPLREKCSGVITDEELLKGARLAKVGHMLDEGKQVNIPLTQAEKNALDVQRSSAFWDEPKDLLLTLFAASLASLTQGWDQAATGNLGWPKEFGLNIDIHDPEGRDVWIFGGIQSIMWFSAAILGSCKQIQLSPFIDRNNQCPHAHFPNQTFRIRSANTSDGKNIVALLATTFFSTAGLRSSTETQAQNDSYKLAIGFGAVNAVFSACAYFLVENKEERRAVKGTSSEGDDEDHNTADLFVYENKGLNVSRENVHDVFGGTEAEPAGNPKRVSIIEPTVTFRDNPKKVDDSEETEERSIISETGQGLSLEARRSSRRLSQETASLSNTEVSSSGDGELYETKGGNKLRGRRFLLLISLFGCIWTLLITALLFNLEQDSPARLPLIALFLMIFTLAEVFPNEGRGKLALHLFPRHLEHILTANIATGVGLLSLFVPFGINWGHGKLLGLFSGLSGLAFILVWFFVPSTNQTATLEDMSYIFGRKLRQHAKVQWKRLLPGNDVTGPNEQWMTATHAGASVSTLDVYRRGTTQAEEGVDEENRESGVKEAEGEKAPPMRESKLEKKMNEVNGEVNDEDKNEVLGEK